MCGIAGIVAPNVETPQKLEELGSTMASTLTHRGPDSHGLWISEKSHLAFAFRRLAIQDLTPAGHQPMSSSSGRYHIIFNGEIYNFLDIAEILKKKGCRFRGHSDTEVVLAAVEEWGIFEMLRLSHGMFAMAIWDEQQKELFLCRDRMGEKPLFFGWINGCFAFASELKAIKKIFPNSLEVNYDALAAFFRFGYVPTPHSIYRNVFKLLPGTCLRIPVTPLPLVETFSPLPSQDTLSPQPYWSLDTIVREGLSHQLIDEEEAITQFDALLRSTILRQKIADVPIGSFLSGGIDSSLISAVMQSVSDRPIKTFTIGFHEKTFDEAPFARAIAKHIGSEHHEYYLGADDGLALIDKLPYYWDEPFADASQIPSMLVAKMARQEVTVCLTGDGGDELFCGYNRYLYGKQLQEKILRIPPLLRRGAELVLTSLPPSLWQNGYLLLKRLTADKQTQANVGMKIHKIGGLLSAGSAENAYRFLLSYWDNPAMVVPGARELPSIIDREPLPQIGDFINDAMYWDQLGYLVDDNLVKGDRSSMAFSLEARLPLLDHQIVEFSWRLPQSMKYRSNTSKWLLRRTLDRYVPRNLIERPKMGFSVPLVDWLRGPLKSWAEDMIFSEPGECAEFVDVTAVKSMWQEHSTGRFDHSNRIWAYCMWHAWREKNVT